MATDASKRIDLAAPLLSVRRHGGSALYGRRNEDAALLGGVPFGWEHWPGRPKSVRHAPPQFLPEPAEEAARSSDALSRADSYYTVNCSVAGLSDAAGATGSPAASGGDSAMMDRFLLAAREQCAFRTAKAGAGHTHARDGDGDGDSSPIHLPVDAHTPANHGQATDTNKDDEGGGEDAHSTAGFEASGRRCGLLLPTRCAKILNPAHAIISSSSKRRRGARRFLSDLGRSCRPETTPLLPQRRPGHDAGTRTWEEAHIISSLARLVRSDRARSLRESASVASEMGMTVRGLYNGQAGGAIPHNKATHLGMLLLLDRTGDGGASSALPSLKRGRPPSSGKTSIGHGFPPLWEEDDAANHGAVVSAARPPALLALPSPKMPTESWLSRALPSVSTKPPATSFLGIHVHQQLRTKQQAPSPCRSKVVVVDHGASMPRRVRIHDLHK